MGGLWAVLPTKIHDARFIKEEEEEIFQDWKSKALVEVDKSGTNFVFMPLCFHIMNLQGQGLGVLRIRVPLSRTDYQSRVERLMSIASHERFFFRNWFSCEAQGNMVWVSCEDYVLSFDVVSGESQTRIIDMDEETTDPFGVEMLRFAYRPSLHMKP